MDPHLTLWWTFFVIVTAIASLFWALGLLVNVGSDGQFCLLASAALLSFVVLGMLLGWAYATAIFFMVLWIYAIIAGTALPPASER